jgi:hypothetical protein
MYLHLQWRIGKQAHQVRLRGYLQRHEVEYGYTQGAYVLVLGSLIAQDEYVFLLEVFYCRQFIW